MEYVVGVDEAGRGPLAGPVAVGVAMVRDDFDWSLLLGVNDSKQLSEKKREDVFVAARRLKAAGQLDFAVSMVSAKVIDKIGIVPAVNLAMDRALRRATLRTLAKGGPSQVVDCVVKLDGGLKAPERFVNQETIIKGDSKEKVIGLASIMAKVTRDRYMTRVATRPAYQLYDLATHKGYGTKKHRTAIKKNGLSDLHRTTFCRNITTK